MTSRFRNLLRSRFTFPRVESADRSNIPSLTCPPSRDSRREWKRETVNKAKPTRFGATFLARAIKRFIAVCPKRRKRQTVSDSRISKNPAGNRPNGRGYRKRDEKEGQSSDSTGISRSIVDENQKSDPETVANARRSDARLITRLRCAPTRLVRLARTRSCKSASADFTGRARPPWRPFRHCGGNVAKISRLSVDLPVYRLAGAKMQQLFIPVITIPRAISRHQE